MTNVVNVLVVEDARIAARAHAAYVNRIRGFRTVATVGSAAACVRRLAEGGIDLVLLDLQLPDGDGLDLAARLREQGYTGELIVMSSAQDADLRRLAAAPAPVPHIAKPFTFADFKDTLISYGGHGGPDVPTVRRRGSRVLPRGLRPDTLEAITGILRDSYAEPTVVSGSDSNGLSASSVASLIGASRITARRYLEYLADAGVLARSLRHRTLGRPEALYRPAARVG